MGPAPRATVVSTGDAASTTCSNGAVDANASSIVEVRAVKRTFDRETAPVRALRGVDLHVGAGEFIAVTGPSGCGKSTLLSIIAGLDVVDEGTVVVAGQEVSALDADARAIHRRTAIGVVFQFFNLIDTMTASQNVAIAAMLGGATRRAADRRARELLDLLGLSDKVDALPSRLSGGQRQRLAIARAMANSPAVLLADEPTGALDTDGGADILRLFSRLHESGQTIVLVTHDPAIAAAAQRVVPMRDGRIVDDVVATVPA
jgi:putative ABC transport system ATP-binding protein